MGGFVNMMERLEYIGKEIIYPKSVFRTMLLQNVSKICQYVSLCY